MSTMKKINPSNSGSFNNALHAQFHDTVCQRLKTGFSLEELNIAAELYEDYQRNIETEIELSRMARIEAETQQLIDLDHERDALIVYFMAAHRTALQSPVAAQRTAAETLEIPLRPYVGMQSEAFDVETLHIKGFLADMGKADYAPSVEALALKEVVTELEAKNKAYEALKVSRTDTRAANAVENSKTVRPRTDANYYEICDWVNASYLMCKDAGVKARIGGLIDAINKLIGEYKVTAKEMVRKENKKG